MFLKPTLRTGGGLIGLWPADSICARVTWPELETGMRKAMRMLMLSIHSTRPVIFRVLSFWSSCWLPENTKILVVYILEQRTPLLVMRDVRKVSLLYTVYTAIGDEGCLEGEPVVYTLIQRTPLLVMRDVWKVNLLCTCLYRVHPCWWKWQM